MNIGATNRSRVGFDQHLSGARRWNRVFLFGEASLLVEGFGPRHHGLRNGLHGLPLPGVQRTYLFILRSIRNGGITRRLRYVDVVGATA